MNDNNYHLDNFSSYTQQVQYTKQPGRIETPQSYFSYSSALLNNFGPNSNYPDVCANPVPQNNSRNQSNSGYQEQIDMFNWENRAIPDLEKVIKFPDKIEMIEISSKDLSPASYCSNIDLLMPELYKSQGKETISCSRYDGQCYYNQGNCQRNYDYPSCVQYEMPAKCCPQKNSDNETLMKSCNFTSDMFLENDTSTKHSNFNKTYCENYIDYNMYNTYDKTQDPQLLINNDFFNNTANIHFDPIDQQTEDSNEDSDIIVEDSDEEISNCDVQEKKQQFTKLNKCLICNLSYTPFGIQFYFLTSKNPLTMSTQKPVVEKIIELVGNVCTSSYLCSECLGLLNTIDHLQLKLSTFNTEFVGKYQQTCRENNIEYTRVKRDTKHAKKVRRYKCKVCQKVLCLQKYFQYHLKRHKSTKILCEHCGRIFTTRKRFLEHKKRFTKPSPPRKIEPYRCTNCSKIFRTNSQLKCHSNVCLGVLPFECKHHHCDKKFATKTQLKYHVKLKHDKKFVAICSICNIGFVKLAAYKNHKLTHTSEKKYSCGKCEKSYKTLSNLRFHMKVHDKLLPFNCSICEKGFLRKDYLDTHVNKHKNIKNYECIVCKKKFGSQKSLDAHSKYHEESKKVTCNICGKTMINGFKDHLRVHNNLKEFECEHCDHKFNTKGALNKHVKKKHFEKYNGD